MTAEQMWAAFQQTHPQAAEYEAWAFCGGGEAADELAALVMSGDKVGTASAYAPYEKEQEPLPQVGNYSVILDSKEQAVCIIQTTRVSVVPFDEVSAHHAYCEGEGDKSLAYWREVHTRFFTKELAEIGMAFDEKMLVVCEEFARVYPE